jgi:hypothetical protein
MLELAFCHYDDEAQSNSNDVCTHKELASLLGATVTSLKEECMMQDLKKKWKDNIQSCSEEGSSKSQHMGRESANSITHKSEKVPLKESTKAKNIQRSTSL